MGFFDDVFNTAKDGVNAVGHFVSDVGHDITHPGETVQKVGDAIKNEVDHPDLGHIIFGVSLLTGVGAIAQGANAAAAGGAGAAGVAAATPQIVEHGVEAAAQGAVTASSAAGIGQTAYAGGKLIGKTAASVGSQLADDITHPERSLNDAVNGVEGAVGQVASDVANPERSWNDTIHAIDKEIKHPQLSHLIFGAAALSGLGGLASSAEAAGAGGAGMGGVASDLPQIVSSGATDAAQGAATSTAVVSPAANYAASQATDPNERQADLDIGTIGNLEWTAAGLGATAGAAAAGTAAVNAATAPTTAVDEGTEAATAAPELEGAPEVASEATKPLTAVDAGTTVPTATPTPAGNPTSSANNYIKLGKQLAQTGFDTGTAYSNSEKASAAQEAVLQKQIADDEKSLAAGISNMQSTALKPEAYSFASKPKFTNYDTIFGAKPGFNSIGQTPDQFAAPGNPQDANSIGTQTTFGDSGLQPVDAGYTAPSVAPDNLTAPLALPHYGLIFGNQKKDTNVTG